MLSNFHKKEAPFTGLSGMSMGNKEYHGYVPPSVSSGTIVGANTGYNYVGESNVGESNTTGFSWPSNTQSGDLVVMVIHMFGRNHLNNSDTVGDYHVPSGWTTYGDYILQSENYVRKVFYKVFTQDDVNAGGHTFPTTLKQATGQVPVPVANTFSACALFTIRGHTKVSKIKSIKNIGSGNSETLSVNRNGSVIMIASDRGASTDPPIYPTITPTTGNSHSSTHDAGYFHVRYLCFDSYTAGTEYTFGDYNDQYGTGAFMIITE